MAKEITPRELRDNGDEIMRALARGESFVVTRNGVPVGDLRPIERPSFVSAEAVVGAFQGAPPIDADRFRADLDRCVD